MGRLEGKVAIVTGGASGMGLATVERFLAEGARVVCGDLNEEAGRRLASRPEAGAARLRFERVDVAVESDVEALVAAALSSFGRLDVMFNNAGVGGALGPITEISVEHWDETFAILVRSVFLGIKHSARALIDQGEGGSILSTASVAALAGGAGPQAYSAAKAAVVNLTQNAAVELAPHRIRVNAINPGIIFTPLMHGGRPDEAEPFVLDVQPWPERGEGEDIAAMALFLAGDESRFVTGQALTVDGGLTAAGTRTWGRSRGSTRVHTVTGIAYGTTGRPRSIRRLDDGD
ncbi:MAG: glucose 1-dehydrogenase [Thermoanaerobaculia bacterium]|nr:glucose 1-dehydrogenase [Thermoanaerobaculia bacterium]